MAEVAEVVALSADDDDLVLRFVGAEEPDGVLGAGLGGAAQGASITGCTDPGTVDPRLRTR